jgi:hypothetical protein
MIKERKTPTLVAVLASWLIFKKSGLLKRSKEYMKEAGFIQWSFIL